MSAGIPCTPLVIPGETKQSEPSAAYLCFLVPVANDHYGCPQHILNEKKTFNWILLVDINSHT